MSNDNGDKLTGGKEPNPDLMGSGKEPIVEPIKEAVKPEVPKVPEPPKDFKIAEIWIKEGQLILDASPEFWIDKLRALGVLEMCKDIVKQYNQPQPKISLVNKGGIKNFVNSLKKRF